MSSSIPDLCPSPAVDPSALPDGGSSDLELAPATPEEVRECALLNSAAWRGPLSIEVFLRREVHLASQAATLDGALSGWVLVDKNDRKSPRTILSACESFRKRALLARRGNQAEEIVAFGIGSVYCRHEYRGKGYAVRMMKELSKKLEDWHQKEGKKTHFTVLYSDIGKKFYAKNGWVAYPSSHVSLKPVTSTASKYPQTRPLRTGDLPVLCQKDETLLKHEVETFPHDGADLRVAFIPNSEVMDWHHAREEFLAKELLGKVPEVRGALVELENQKAVWCIWSRVFALEKKDNTFYILRLVIEGEDGDRDHSLSSERLHAVAACLAAAQDEATGWNMNDVQVWNPSPIVQAAAVLLDPTVKVIHREQESIAALNWRGEKVGPQHVQWVANEKFGWC